MFTDKSIIVLLNIYLAPTETLFEICSKKFLIITFGRIAKVKLPGAHISYYPVLIHHRINFFTILFLVVAWIVTDLETAPVSTCCYFSKSMLVSMDRLVLFYVERFQQIKRKFWLLSLTKRNIFTTTLSDYAICIGSQIGAYFVSVAYK